MATTAFFQTEIPDTPIGDDAGLNVYVSPEIFQGFVKEYHSFTREMAYGMLRELCLFAIKKDQVKEAGRICEAIFKLTGTVMPVLPKSTPEKPEYDFSDLLKISEAMTKERLAEINDQPPPPREEEPPLDESIDPLSLKKFTRDKAFACYREIYLRAFRTGKIASARITMDRICGLRGFVAAKRIPIGDLEVVRRMARDDQAIPTDEVIHKHEATRATQLREQSGVYAEDDAKKPQHIAEKPYAVPAMPLHMAAGKPKSEWTEAEVHAEREYYAARKLMLAEMALYHSRLVEPKYASEDQYEEAGKYYALDEEHLYKEDELKILIDAGKAGRAAEVGAASVQKAKESIVPAHVLLEKAYKAAKVRREEVEEKDGADSRGSDPPSRGPP